MHWADVNQILRGFFKNVDVTYASQDIKLQVRELCETSLQLLLFMGH